MNAPVRAKDLCIRTWPPEERVLAVISAYSDDSKTDGQVWLLAGFAGYPNQWEMFEREWAALHDRHGVPYFHMREMAKPNGVFAKWWPPEEHQDEVAAYFKDVVQAVQRPYMPIFGSVAYLPDLERFNRDYQLDLKPYSLCAYACIGQMALHFGPHMPITAVFDRVEKVDDKLSVARSYLEHDEHPTLADKVTSTALARGITSRNVPALQAADLAAWEGRRTHMSFQPWHQASEHPQEKSRPELWEEFKQFCRENYGQEYPVLRKSFEALIDGNMRVNFVVWDYWQLADMHRARRGIWTAADAERQRA